MRANYLYSTPSQIEGITNLPRFVKLINQSIAKLELNLKNLNILTEAASGNYICTPIIAAMSKASNVYAYAQDSNYGKAEDIFYNTRKLAELLGIRKRIKFIETLDNDIIKKADIVTNLGPLRPITKEFIAKMKNTAVIPLMRETWEFRKNEIDLEACKDKGIVVLGTNENHPKLKIFDYLGHLCAKKIFEMDVEILNTKIIVIGGGHFGLNIMTYLAKLGADVKSICDEDKKIIDKLGVEKIGSISKKCLDLSKMKNADAIIVTTYPDNTETIGSSGLIFTKQLKKICPGISIIQFKGNIDRDSIIKEDIQLLPEKEPKGGHMSWTLNDLGPKPVIDLHTGGLKVGEIMVRLRLSGHSYEESIKKSLNHSITQDFSQKQKVKYL